MDTATGVLYRRTPFYNWFVGDQVGNGSEYSGVSFQRNSRLLIAEGCFGAHGGCWRRFYIWVGNKFKLLHQWRGADLLVPLQEVVWTVPAAFSAATSPSWSSKSPTSRASSEPPASYWPPAPDPPTSKDQILWAALSVRGLAIQRVRARGESLSGKAVWQIVEDYVGRRLLGAATRVDRLDSMGEPLAGCGASWWTTFSIRGHLSANPLHGLLLETTSREARIHVASSRGIVLPNRCQPSVSGI
jgi:hypothetical protein